MITELEDESHINIVRSLKSIGMYAKMGQSTYICDRNWYAERGEKLYSLNETDLPEIIREDLVANYKLRLDLLEKSLQQTRDEKNAIKEGR